MLTSVHPALDARIYYREARAAARGGYDVVVIAPGPAPSPSEHVSFVSLPGGGSRWRRPLRWPLVVARAAQTRADIVQLHDPELLPWGYLLRRLTGRPVVYDRHEFFAETIHTKLWIPGPLRPGVAFLAGSLERWFAARLDAVVVVTEEMADRWRGVHRNIVVVQNFPLPEGTVDPPSTAAPAAATAAETSSIVPARGRFVIYAGLMNVERGLRLLYEVATAVRQRHPDVEIIVLGPVEWQGLPAHQRRSPAAWADAGVRFIPPVPQPEVARYLEAATIAWLPMDPRVPGKRLAWPVKLGEYAAAGLPIVASDLPVQAEVIRAAGCGIVVADYTPEAHAAAIDRLLDEPSLAQALGSAGRRYALAHLSWEEQAARLLRLYASLVQAGRR